MRWFERSRRVMRAVASFLTVVWGRIVMRDKASIEAMQWVVTLHSCSDLEPLLPELNRWLDKRPANRDRFNELWDDWQELSVWRDRCRWTALSSVEPRANQRCWRRPDRVPGFAAWCTSGRDIGVSVGRR